MDGIGAAGVWFDSNFCWYIGFGQSSQFATKTSSAADLSMTVGNEVALVSDLSRQCAWTVIRMVSVSSTNPAHMLQ